MLISWYTSFACGKAAIQSSGCTLTTQAGQTFNLNGISGQDDDITATPSTNQQYTYALQICQRANLYRSCDPLLPEDTRIIQRDGNVCHSLGRGNGTLRYADGTLSFTFSHGDTCHSNFARTSFITFLCPDDLKEDRKNTNVTFLGEEDCFYQFEWVTSLACGSKHSGVSKCQFELPEMGVYNFAPLVGIQDVNWVALSSDSSYSCFMINPCGELGIADTSQKSGTDYCNVRTDKTRKAPKECIGSSVCSIHPDGSAKPIGMFDLGQMSGIRTVDKHVVSITGHMKGSNYSATIHYVCKPGDLSSAPVFVGVVDQYNYEFHWNTYAACPSGLQSGADCTVSFQGYLFNLSSIPVLNFTSSDKKYLYEISVCSVLKPTLTHCNSSRPGICQVARASNISYSLGQVNSTLIYEDGTLRLTYSGGHKCQHVSSSPRNTTVLFICDSNAHTPSITSVTEDLCTYVVEVQTKLACPPGNRATECIFFNGSQSYDFSDLSRSLDQGNWETRGPDDSEYFINVCQPLNRVSGCSPLAGACRIWSQGGQTRYTNLGLAYNTSFHQDEDGHVKLVYEFPSSSQGCPRVFATIEFICTHSAYYTEVIATYMYMYMYVIIACC